MGLLALPFSNAYKIITWFFALFNSSSRLANSNTSALVLSKILFFMEWAFIIYVCHMHLQGKEKGKSSEV